MSRQMLYRLPPVVISAHAWERWNERARRRPRKRAALAGMLARQLYGHMRTGGIEARGLAVELDMGGGIRAVLRLGDGAWVCTTVMDAVEKGGERWYSGASSHRT